MSIVSPGLPGICAVLAVACQLGMRVSPSTLIQSLAADLASRDWQGMRDSGSHGPISIVALDRPGSIVDHMNVAFPGSA